MRRVDTTHDGYDSLDVGHNTSLGLLCVDEE